MSSHNEGLQRAIDNGSLIFNAIFVKQVSRQRVWNTAIRLSQLDMLVIAVVTSLFALLGVGLARLLMMIPGVDSSRGMGFMLIFGASMAFAGLLFGRALVRFSPYSKTSGEGLGEWFRVQWDQRYRLVDRMVGRSQFRKMSTTWVDGEAVPVECRVLLGSAPVPRAPIPRFFAGDMVRFKLLSRTVPTDWVRRERARVQMRRMEEVGAIYEGGVRKGLL